MIILFIIMEAMSQHSGHLESVLVAMTCRAVRYFLPCDLDLSEGKNNEGCIGLIFPCFLFGKNAEFLGSRTLIGSCMTHFFVWALVNTVCCMLTDGIVWGIPGCFMACYACGYRRALRSRRRLVETLLHIFSVIYVLFAKNTGRFKKGPPILAPLILDWRLSQHHLFR
ncbi:uncharacterized protein LOC131144623 isoform X4 [Malania oleifera]|uniref:uncharacterized protein LOC131144623 isoform X4 n=1 Tax=Malania oleifera TaxID=397392 RepID=UPI0025ADCC02|nr:uncharacterized protein LOC131144623 isoform X4 [Malania oleifera]